LYTNPPSYIFICDEHPLCLPKLNVAITHISMVVKRWSSMGYELAFLYPLSTPAEMAIGQDVSGAAPGSSECLMEVAWLWPTRRDAGRPTGWAALILDGATDRARLKGRLMPPTLPGARTGRWRGCHPGASAWNEGAHSRTKHLLLAGRYAPGSCGLARSSTRFSAGPGPDRWQPPGFYPANIVGGCRMG
jgi:hypothetical protein